MVATIHFFMTRRTGIGMLIMALLLGFFMVACTPPTKPASLQSAEAAVEQVQSEPGVTRYALVELDKAQETLQEAQRTWRYDKSPDKVAHPAYLAQQYARIAAVAAEGEEAQAQIRAQIKDLQAQIKDLSKGRDQMKQRLSELQAKKTNRGYVLTLGNILFELDKAELTSDAMQSLSRLVKFLKDFPEREVVIKGYTDSTGSEAYNLDLSQRRAEAVRRFLVDNGIAPERIVARGYGEAYPVASNDTAAGRVRNRRVDIVILNEGEKAGDYHRPR